MIREASYSDFGSSRSPLGALLGLLALLLAGGMLLAVVYGQHAVSRHGNEALSIRDCLQRNGPYQTWQHRLDKNRLYQVCQLEDGRWGLQALQKIGDDLIERTAFVKSDGSWAKLIQYLSKFATRVKH